MSSKKNTSASQRPAVQQAAQTGSATLGDTASPMAKYLPLVVLFLLAFLLYGNTIGHSYALDDAIVITDNQYTKDGFAGLGKIFSTDAFEGFFGQKKDLVQGGRYRPLSIATFAIEWSLFGKSPHISHFGNVLLYGLLGILLFLFLNLLFPQPNRKSWWMGAPFLLTVLFMVHPIHTEVVANIKGRDELMAMLFLMLSMIAGFKFVDTQKMFWLGITLAAFFLGLLAKETPLPFVLIFPLSLWFFRREASISKFAIASLPILVATIAYLGLRFNAVGFGGGTLTEQGTEILNDPFIGATSGQRAATVMETWGMYLVKLFAPIHLSHDYYFNQIPITNWSNPIVLGSLLVNIGLLALGIYLTTRRNVIGYGILFYFIAFSITSNLVISIGTTMGERFVFVPSLGFLIAIFFALTLLFRRIGLDPNKPVLYLSVLLSVVFVLRTVVRNVAWKNNYTLFTTDAETSPNSAKVQTAAGGVLIEKADDPKTPEKDRKRLYQDALKHLNKAVQIYPQHGNAWLLMGNAQHKLEDYPASLASYEKVMNHRPLLWDAYKNAAVTARKIKRYDLASAYYRLQIKRQEAASPPVKVLPQLWFDVGSNYEEWGGHADSAIWAYGIAYAGDAKMAAALGQTGRVYGMQLGNLDKAIEFGERAVAIDPKLDWVYENIGIATAMKGDPAAAIAVFQRGLAVNPNSANLHKNLGITYMSINETAKGQASLARAKELNPNLQ